MKKLAARDFEDLLQVCNFFFLIIYCMVILFQCSIPVFKNLLPNKHHNTLIMDMFFIFCTWHAYAKLRLHTSSTLQALAEMTRALGASLQQFVKVICSYYATKELPREEAAQVHRRAKASAQEKETTTSDKPSSTCGRFNMNAYKLHALGDYVANIWLYGTTDSHSTQVVSYFTCLSFLILKENCRVSLSTAVLSVSMHEQIKGSHLPNK